ncbi:hypothetical protein HY025_02515 [Candidatus Daviesbacteria bacterium]|nr:hypothetical protein [Candidatus Daviesbacteria bacterium]
MIQEKSEALYQLGRDLDPFQEDPKSKRLRAIGLKNLYLQMADPSIEALEATTRGLVCMPFSHIRQLQFSTYDAGENPQGFFARHGITIDDSEKLHAGIGNSFELIESVVHRFDLQTGELNWGEELNPEALADSAYERIQIRNGERQIRKMAEDVRSEPKLARRYRKGLALKKKVLGYVNGFPFTFHRGHSRDEVVEPTWGNLQHRSYLSTELNTKDGSSISGSFGLGEAIDVAQAAILRYPFERRLEQLPKRDKDRFDQLRLQYGAKAANLIIFSELVEDINRLRKGYLFDVTIAVPEFQAVPVDSYRAWRDGKLIDDQLQPYFDWASALKDDDRRYSEDPSPADYMIRSSAVFSEDGQTVTGAGIYHSERVRGGATFEDFKGAVTRVYESTDSPQAQAYRAQHGIDKEEMGLVIQRFVSPHSFSMHGQSTEGYINSRLPGVPNLMEIVTGTSRNFVNREELDFFIALDVDRNDDAFRTVHHFRPDQFKVAPHLPIRVAQLTYAVERIWDRNVQAEFVGEGHTIHFVQVRGLPTKAVEEAPEIKFPDETPIHSGASIGFGDMELPVLDEDADNTEKSGVVVFRGNYGWTMEQNDYHLPKEGAVIIYNSDGRNGHIQTLCAERGLVCLFPDRNEDDFALLRYHDLSKLRKVRIVSNGIEARVYKRES